MVATVIYSVTMVLLERNRISSLYSRGKARWKRNVVSWVSYYYTIGSGVIKQALHLDEGERIVKLKDNAKIECTANGRMYCAAVACRYYAGNSTTALTCASRHAVTVYEVVT